MIGTIIMGLCVWALNKVYTLVTEKIDTNNNLVNIRALVIQTEFDNKKIATKLDLISKDIDELRQKTIHLTKKNIDTLDELHRMRDDLNKKMDKHMEILGKYGKVIVILHKDYVKRRDG